MHTVCGFERRITSSLIEISSGSFSPSAKRLRISIGMTIRPRSSMWRMIPVFVAPLFERDLRGRSVVPFDPMSHCLSLAADFSEHVPAFAISNHHSGLRDRAESFV
jgi:hypothetical protein